MRAKNEIIERVWMVVEIRQKLTAGSTSAGASLATAWLVLDPGALYPGPLAPLCG